MTRRTPRTRSPLSRDEAGVSAVVGAVLVLLVATLFLVEWRLEWAPAIESEKEAAHSLAVDAQLGQLRSHLNHLATNRSDDSAGLPVTLGAPASSALTDATRLPSVLSFSPEDARVTFSTDDMLLLQRNGNPLAVPSGAWSDFEDTTDLTEVHAIADLRLRIDNVDMDHNDRSTTVTLLDGTDAVGSYTVRVDIQNPNMLVIHEVRNAANEIVTSRVEGYHQSTAFAPFYVNVLDPGMAFDQVLSAAGNGPFTVRISHDEGFDTDYIATYSLIDSTGEVVTVGSGGQQVADWTHELAGGTLTYAANNQFYPAQEVRLANGALVLSQADGRLFRAEPPLEVRTVGTQTVVTWSVPVLEGDERSIAGDMVVHLFASPLQHESLLGSATDLTIVQETPDPGLWSSLWRQRLEAADLSSGGTEPEFQITTGTNQVTVVIHGTDSSPTSTVRDVQVALRTTNIHVQFQT